MSKTAARLGSFLILSLPLGALLATLAGLGSSSGQPTTPTHAPLRLGQPVVGSLGFREHHHYRFTMAEGAYLHLEVEERGVDLKVTLRGPDDSLLVAVDDHHGGPVEPVFWIAEVTGAYRVDIEAISGESGDYETRIVELRPSTGSDPTRARAELLYSERAAGFGGAATEAARRRGLVRCEEARTLFEELGDAPMVAHAWNCSGRLHDALSEGRSALEHYRRALELFRSLEDRRSAGMALHNLGDAYTDLGSLERAEASYREALALRRATGDRLGEGYTLNGLAGVAYFHGDPRQAIRYFEQALDRIETGEELEAKVRNNLGVVHLHLEEPRRALAYLTRALELRREEPGWDGESPGEAAAYNNLGLAYRLLGDLDAAREHFKHALHRYRAAGNRRQEATAAGNLAEILSSSPEPREALRHASRALALSREVEDPAGEARALGILGMVQLQLGEESEALDIHLSALEIARGLRRPLQEVEARRKLGATYARLGDLAEGFSQVNRALAILRNLGETAGTYPILFEVAELERRLGRPRAALRSMEEGLELLESLRGRVARQELRASLGARHHSSYEAYIDLLMELHRREPGLGFAAEALAASERARARGLLDLLTEAGAEVRKGAQREWLLRERQLRQRLNDSELHRRRLLAEGDAGHRLASTAREIAGLVRELQEVEARIRLENPRHAALTQPKPLSVRQIQELLDPGTVLLEYSLGETRSVVWAVSTNSLESRELPPRAEVEALARRVFELASRPSPGPLGIQLELETARLSQMLLAPVGELLTRQRLWVVSDGALRYIPFALLPEPTADGGGKNLLANRRSILHLPSASVLAEQQHRVSRRALAPAGLAVLADPVFELNDPRLRQVQSSGAARETGANRFRRLPFSRQEAKAIAAFVSPAESFLALDFEASRETLMAPALSNYRILHIATHGILNSHHPELSGLVLSRFDAEGQPRDGFVRAHEIYNLDLPAELVVLSACRTALGKEIRGEGLVGLTHAFLYAGAARVLVSLWDVHDEATAKLMEHFYRGLLQSGLPPEVALREAQIAVRREPRWRPPYFWAGFILQGIPAGKSGQAVNHSTEN